MSELPTGLSGNPDYSQLASFDGFLRAATNFVHRANIKWWQDINTGTPIKRNVGELLMLCVSELSEAMEGHRKHLMDDHLPNRPMIEVELADCLIRILDLAGGLGLDVAGAFCDKLIYNALRQDHTHEARRKEGGKKY